MLQIGLIEDDSIVREVLQEYLNDQPELTCGLAAGSVEAFLAQLPATAHLDVVLTDIGLPGMSGLEGMPLIRARLPQADLMVLSVYHDAQRIFQALCAGATGYLLKSTPLPELKASIQTVAAGGSVMSPDVARKVLGFFQQPPVAGVSPLTARERQIVDGLLEGLSYKLIADRLQISLDTVRFHFKNIYKKLHVNSQAELLRKMRHPGL